MKQQEYENQQAELARQEAIRQYNQNLALQYAQMQASNNSGYTFGDTPSNTSDYYVKTQYYDGYMPSTTLADLQRGAFKTQDVNGNVYQPNNVNGQKLSNAGKAGYYLGSKATNSSGVNISEQNLWQTPDGKFYIWNGSKMAYEQVQIPHPSNFMS